MTRDELLDLLHDLDGHLGLAAHRREGDQPEWRSEAHRLIGRIREAIEGLAEDTVVLLHYDGTTCQNPTCGWGHRPALIGGSGGDRGGAPGGSDQP